MLFYGGMSILVYDEMMTGSGSWRAMLLPLTESSLERLSISA